MKNLVLKTIVASSFVQFIRIAFRVRSGSWPYDDIDSIRLLYARPKADGRRYLISSTNPASGQTAIIFTKKDGTGNGGIVNLIAADLSRDKRGTQPVLTFNRYGSSYFLSGLQNGVDDFAAHAPQMKMEKSISKEFGRP